MADPLLRVNRSRGFNSLIRGETLDQAFREAIDNELKPFVKKEFGQYVENWKIRPKFGVERKVGQALGQRIFVKVEGTQIAVDRWNMIDTKGRRGGKIIKSTKFKTVRRKSAGVTRVRTTKAGVKLTSRVTTKGGTYKRLIPMPIRNYDSKLNKYGELVRGSGEYDDDNVVFRTKVRQGEVTPIYITRDVIAPVIRKEMTRVVENAYRRAFLKITGRGI